MLDQLSADRSLDRFRGEYQKILRAVRKSHGACDQLAALERPIAVGAYVNKMDALCAVAEPLKQKRWLQGEAEFDGRSAQRTRSGCRRSSRS